MSRKLIETSIGSYRSRLETAKSEAVKAIEAGLYGTAIHYITDAAKYQAAIDELEFILDAMEVE